MEQTKLLITVKELSQLLNIGMNSAYRLTHSEGFPILIIGKKRLIYINLLYKWLEKTSNYSI